MIKQPQKCFTYGQYCQKIETVLVTFSMFEKGDAHDYLLRPSNKIAMINLVILKACLHRLCNLFATGSRLEKNSNRGEVAKVAERFS